MSKLCFATILILSGIFSSCQSTPRENFADVKLGMDKHGVLHIMGSPDVARRWQGRDRWIYNFDAETTTTMVDPGEVHFSNGLVVYKGAPPLPEVTAEEQDRRNAQENAALNAKWDQQRQARKNLYPELEEAVRQEATRSETQAVE